MFQELTVLAHAVLYSESTGNIDAVFSSGTTGNSVEKQPKYRFKRSESFCGITVPFSLKLCWLVFLVKFQVAT